MAPDILRTVSTSTHAVLHEMLLSYANDPAQASTWEEFLITFVKKNPKVKRKKKTGACHITDFPEKIKLFSRERFEHFSAFGYRTGRKEARWGYRIDDHRCVSGAEFSESENES